MREEMKCSKCSTVLISKDGLQTKLERDNILLVAINRAN